MTEEPGLTVDDPRRGFVQDLRARFHSAVLDGTMVDEMWGQSCTAYNIQFELSPESRATLCTAQAALASTQAPGVLRLVPPAALHLSVAWLVEVRQSYALDRRKLWRRHGVEWLEQVREACAETPPINLTFRWLVVTPAAIIAVATPRAGVLSLRRALAETLRLPPETPAPSDLVHATIARYSSALTDAERLVGAAEQLTLSVPARFTEVEVSEEMVYPSLEKRVLGRLPLLGPSGAAHSV